MDATDGEHPEGTTVQSSVFREIGVYGKQVSAFASALAFRTTINGSIFFNGPRAGINWNDGSECSAAVLHLSFGCLTAASPKIAAVGSGRRQQHHTKPHVQLGPGDKRSRRTLTDDLFGQQTCR